MTTIYKYPLTVIDRQAVMLPRGARILTAQVQDAAICLWAEVDSEAPKESRHIWIFGTGHRIPDDLRLDYIGSVQDRPFVWHIYAELFRGPS